MGVIYKARQIAMNRLVALKAINPAKLESPGTGAVHAAEVGQPDFSTTRISSRCTRPTLMGRSRSWRWSTYRVSTCCGWSARSAHCRCRMPSTTFARPRRVCNTLRTRTHSPRYQAVEPDGVSRSDRLAGVEGRLPKVKILDMGLARVVTPEGQDSEQGLTQPGVFLGTPDYVAPEQAEDAHRPIRAPISSVSAEPLYFLLTAEVPYPGKTLVEKVRRAVTGPPSVLAKRKDAPPSLDGVVQMPAPDPADRYQTPSEVVSRSTGSSGREGAGIAQPPRRSPRRRCAGRQGPRRGPRACDQLPMDTLVTAGEDSRLRLQKRGQTAGAKTYLGDFGSVDHPAAPNGKWVATCATRLTTTEMGVQLWDLATGAERRRCAAGREHPLRRHLSRREGHRGRLQRQHGLGLVQRSGHQDLLHEGPRGNRRLVHHTELISDSAWMGPSGSGTLRTGKTKGTIQAAVGPIAGLAFGSTSRWPEITLAVRQPGSSSFARFTGHSGNVLCAAFSPDGRLLASGGLDRMVRVWSTEDSTEIAAYAGHAQSVLAVAFARAARRSTSTGQDGMPAAGRCRWSNPDRLNLRLG